MHVGGGKKSPPSTPPKTPRIGRHSRTPSWSPSPKGRGDSRNDHYRRPTPPRISSQTSQCVHHGSQYGGGSSNFDHDSQYFMRMQQNPSFQECVEKYIYQNKDVFLNNLIDKDTKVP